MDFLGANDVKTQNQLILNISLAISPYPEKQILEEKVSNKYL